MFKRAKALIPLLAGFLLIAPVGSASENSNEMKMGGTDTNNCVCRVEPKNESHILDQRECMMPQAHKKENKQKLSYKKYVEDLRRELLKTSPAT